MDVGLHYYSLQALFVHSPASRTHTHIFNWSHQSQPLMRSTFHHHEKSCTTWRLRSLPYPSVMIQCWESFQLRNRFSWWSFAQLWSMHTQANRHGDRNKTNGGKCSSRTVEKEEKSFHEKPNNIVVESSQRKLRDASYSIYRVTRRFAL